MRQKSKNATSSGDELAREQADIAFLEALANAEVKTCKELVQKGQYINVAVRAQRCPSRRAATPA